MKEQIILPKGQKEQLLLKHKKSIEVVTFFKYKIDEKDGMIPTIKVNLRSNSTNSTDSFKSAMKASYDQLKVTFPDFSYVKSPSVMKLNGRDCIYTICTYTIQGKSGKEKVKSSVYAIPLGETYYQVVFMESEKEDCSTEFEKALKSIRIN